MRGWCIGYQADLASLRVRQTAQARQAVETALADQPVRGVTVAPIGPGERIAVRVLAYDGAPDESLSKISALVEEALPALIANQSWSLTVLTRDARIERAVRSALAARPVESITATRALGVEPSRVAVTVAGDADDEQAKEIGDLVEEALAELDLDEGWQINVSLGGGPESIEGLQIDLSTPVGSP